MDSRTDWWSRTRSLTQEHLAHLRVAVYASGGAPSHHLALIALWGGRPRVIHAEEVLQGGLEDLDAVIFPGGGLLAMAGQIGPLGERGVARIRDWVEAGGTYIGTCAGSCHPLEMGGSYLAALPVAAGFQMCAVTPLNAAAGDWGLDSPGTGRLRVASEDHPLLEGLDEPFEIVHYNGPLFPPELGAAGRVLGPTAHFTPFEASSGGDPRPVTLERAMAAGARIAYRQAVGSGQVILFGSHPEFGASALQLGWLPASRLLANALRLVPTRGEAGPVPGRVDRGVLDEAVRLAGELHAVLERLAPLAASLPVSAPPFLGYSGPELWRETLAESRLVLEGMGTWFGTCPSGDSLDGAFLLDTEPQLDQDFGFAGVRQLLGRALAMSRAAEATPPDRWPAFSGAYNEFLEHPYHMVASVYLSAGGLIASAGLQATAFAALNRLPDPHLVPLTA